MRNNIEQPNLDDESFIKTILCQLIESIKNLESLIDSNPNDLWAQNELKKKRQELEKLSFEES